MSERVRYPDGDVERDDDAEANDPARSTAEQAEARQSEMEESGEENVA